MMRYFLIVLMASISQFAVAGGAKLCTAKNGGVVNLRNECKKNEVVVDPTQLGLVGSAGAQGPVGPAGPQGPVGPAGPQGVPSTPTACSLKDMDGVWNFWMIPGTLPVSYTCSVEIKNGAQSDNYGYDTNFCFGDDGDYLVIENATIEHQSESTTGPDWECTFVLEFNKPVSPGVKSSESVFNRFILDSSKRSISGRTTYESEKVGVFLGAKISPPEID